MLPHISIVVPVYNVETYLKECIESIRRQTYQNFEVILVDDGSSDQSGRICDEYAKIDKRVRVIHKANGGLSDARNVGIKIARGEFLTFIDSDDYISDNYLGVLMNAQQRYDADIVQGEMTKKCKKLGKTNPKFTVEVMEPKEAFRKLLCYKRPQVYACCKLYRKTLLLNNSIFYPVGRLNEDCATTYKMILQSNRSVFIPEIIYFYRTTENSILNSVFSIRRMELWRVPIEIQEYLGKNKRDFEKELEYYKFRVGINLINESIFSQDANVEKERNKIIEHLRKMKLNGNSLGWKYKVIQEMICLNPNLYCIVVKHLRRRK